jgi:FkbM family methyltransferase
MNKFTIRALNKLKVLKYLNVNGSILLNNKKFKIPILQRTGFDNLFMSEPWMIDLLKIVLKIDHDGFIDIGVNVGQTLLKLKSVAENIDYIGFEPNPLCVYYTKNLIKENNLTNCKLIPVGVSDATDLGVLNFFSDSTTDSSASIITNFRPSQRVVRSEYVPLFELEQIRSKINLNKFSILKIDVEGAELEVIKSFYSAIEEYKPIILIEILPAYNAENLTRIVRQKELLEIVRSLDYSVFRVIKQNDIFIDLLEVPDIEIHSDLNSCEYVMVPNFKKEKLKKYCKQAM